MKRKYTPCVLIAPTTLILFGIIMVPLLYAFILSFQRWDLTKPLTKDFVFWKNYMKALNDPVFWTSMKNTCYFTGVSIGIEFFLGLGIALLLDREWKHRILRTIVRSCFLIPMLIAPVVVGLIWAMMLNTEWGVLNYFCRLLGLPVRNWLGISSTAMGALIMVDVWEKAPWFILILLAGLQSISRNLYEASKIDGASRWQLFKYITLPLLAPACLVVLVLRTMMNFVWFDTAYIMTGGGPGYATELISLHAYRYAFKYFRMGQASARAFLGVVVIMIMTYIYIKLLSKSSPAE